MIWALACLPARDRRRLAPITACHARAHDPNTIQENIRGAFGLAKSNKSRPAFW